MQTGTKGGRVGFVTHNTPANFDDMLVGSPFGEQLFKDDFSSGLNPRWSTSSKIGVVTHWSKGQFDNVIVRDDPAR